MAMRITSMPERAPSFVFELGTIVGYRPVGDIRLIGDLRHRPTGRDQAQDLEFARAQVRHVTGFRTGAEKRDLTRQFWVQMDASLRD